MSELSVIVSHNRGEDGRNYFDIKFPSNQDKIGIEASTMILAGGIALLIKAGHNRGDIKDHELLDWVVTYLQSEFISNDSFKDAVIHPNTI
jgi:hypothetical protein